MQTLNCLIVEDELLAARVIADYIDQTENLALAGIYSDVFSAQRKIDEGHVDLIFLDINLPKMNGIEFTKKLNKRFHIILTTAYHEFAVEGFELEVVDYLLKPISMERFTKAANKVFDIQKLRAQGDTSDSALTDHIFVKAGGKMEKVFFEEILYVESLQNYALIHTASRKIITYSTLKNIEGHLPASHFVKVQKSYIVAIHKISSLQGGNVYIGQTVIPVSRKLKDELRNRILTNNLSKT